MRLLVFIAASALITQSPPVKRFIINSVKEIRADFFENLEDRSRIQHKARRQEEFYRWQHSPAKDETKRSFDSRPVSQQLIDTRARTIREFGGY